MPNTALLFRRARWLTTLGLVRSLSVAPSGQHSRHLAPLANTLKASKEARDALRHGRVDVEWLGVSDSDRARGEWLADAFDAAAGGAQTFSPHDGTAEWSKSNEEKRRIYTTYYKPEVTSQPPSGPRRTPATTTTHHV